MNAEDLVCLVWHPATWSVKVISILYLVLDRIKIELKNDRIVFTSPDIPESPFEYTIGDYLKEEERVRTTDNGLLIGVYDRNMTGHLDAMVQRGRRIPQLEMRSDAEF